MPKWQLSEPGLTVCSYLFQPVKCSQGQPHLQICPSATPQAIQSLAPKDNYFSSSSWFLLSSFNFSWPAATSTLSYNSPSLSSWCSRSPGSLFKVIWLLSQGPYLLLPLSDCLVSQQKQPVTVTITASEKRTIVWSKKRGTVQQVHCTVHETKQALGQRQRIFKETTVEPLRNSTSDRYFLVRKSLKQTAGNPILIKAGQLAVNN